MMKPYQRGFTFIEVAVATAIIALIASAATMTTFSVLRDTGRTNDRMTAVRQVENAGYWVSRDTLMADRVCTENLTPPDFLILDWTDWGYDEDSIYHSVTYSIEDVSGGIGKLKRTHQDSEGTNEQMLVAEYIYYNQSDPSNTSDVSYQNPLLTLKIASVLGDAQETREYKVYRRPNFQ
jgi:prepilin-type N-terminal cleavage/methylation domain-containing protein